MRPKYHVSKPGILENLIIQTECPNSGGDGEGGWGGYATSPLGVVDKRRGKVGLT